MTPSAVTTSDRGSMEIPSPQSHIEMPKPVRGTDEKARPPMIVEQPSSSPPQVPSPSNEEHTSTVALDSKSKSLPPAAVTSSSGLAAPVPVTITRSTSPAPSLEAILLDRKRRLGATTSLPSATVASSVGSSSSLALPTAAGPAMSSGISVRTGSVKGTRFKSSPLGGGDRNGVVKVKENTVALQDEDKTSNREDRRRPDTQKVNEGPGKDTGLVKEDTAE